MDRIIEFPTPRDSTIRNTYNAAVRSEALWGRVTYEMMESYWPAVARRDQEAPPEMREWAAKPKCLVSSTRKDFPWTNRHHIAGDLRKDVQKLKDATPAGVLISSKLATELDRLGLIDEYKGFKTGESGLVGGRSGEVS